jgi:hypothetical protein
MPCDDPIYSPRGRGGLGVIQPQSGLDYPLVAPSEDIRYLIADFYLAYDDPGLYVTDILKSQLPLRIKWLYGIGCEENEKPEFAPEPTHSADILITDSNDEIVFDSTGAARFTEKDWGNDYRVYEWVRDTNVCRLVVYKTWAPDESGVRTYDLHIAADSAVLDSRAVYKLPKRVKSVRVLTTELISTDIDLICGYNIGMAAEANIIKGFRRANEITISAEPGLGLGRYSDCTDDPPDVVRLNGVTGPDITIAATDCLWTRVDAEFNADQTELVPQKTNSINPAIFPVGTMKLSLGSNCPACCDCADYVNTGRYMNCVRDRYKIIGNDSHQILLQHTDNISRWVEQRECRIQKPLKVLMTPQLCPVIDVVVQFCNLCETCAEDVNLNIQFGTYPSGGQISVLHCYTVLSAGLAKNFPYYIQSNSANSFNVNFGKVSAGNSADIQFRISVSPEQPVTVTAAVTGTKKENNAITPIRAGCNATAAVAAASASAALACDENGNTISVC